MGLSGSAVRPLRFLEAHRRALVVALILLASLRIVSTYAVFSHTSDEPCHIACGIEWLASGVYTWEPQHPPLARVAAAIGPYLDGARPHNTPRNAANAMIHEGDAILFAGNRYDRTIALARLGMLPFFWVGCLTVYLWGARNFGAAAGVIALFLFSFLPPVLAHAGLAATDMAVAAFLPAAFLAGLVWMERPSMKTAAMFGVCTALGVLSKFSMLVYFPAAAGFALGCYCLIERPKLRWIAAAAKARAATFGAAALTAGLIVWAMYRFSFGPTVYGFSAPAPEFFAGFQRVLGHNAGGHASYLLGRQTQFGVWYYFPLMLAVKTPIGFLLLLGFGIGKRAWMPLAYSAGILVVAMSSNINIGVRHILPIYAGLSLLAALGAVRLLEAAPDAKWMGTRRIAQLTAAVALAWFAGSSLLAHPDYLPYFNELAGAHPEKIAVDSDLDWGQDFKRLAKRLNQVHAGSVAMIPFLDELPPGAFGLPRMQTQIDPLKASPGWNAVSITIWKSMRLGLRGEHPEYTLWPDRVAEPPEHIGKGILLWHFPESAKDSGGAGK